MSDIKFHVSMQNQSASKERRKYIRVVEKVKVIEMEDFDTNGFAEKRKEYQKKFRGNEDYNFSRGIIYQNPNSILLINSL